jgi:hypothetical protein
MEGPYPLRMRHQCVQGGGCELRSTVEGVVEQAATPVLFTVEVWELGTKEMGTPELVGKRTGMFL